MSSRVPHPDHRAVAVEFGGALQNLIAETWGSAELQGQVSNEQGVVRLLECVFGALAYEMGRVDGVARLHGVGREQMLALLAKAYAAGKAATLAQHHEDSEGCTCDASVLLKKELELN